MKSEFVFKLFDLKENGRKKILGAFSPMNERMEFIKIHYTVANAWKLFCCIRVIRVVTHLVCRHHLFPLIIYFLAHFIIATEKCSQYMQYSLRTLFDDARGIDTEVFNQFSIVWTSETCTNDFRFSDTKCTQNAYIYFLWVRVASKRPVKNDLTQSQNSIIRKLSTLHHKRTTHRWQCHKQLYRQQYIDFYFSQYGRR